MGPLSNLRYYTIGVPLSSVNLVNPGLQPNIQCPIHIQTPGIAEKLDASVITLLDANETLEE